MHLCVPLKNILGPTEIFFAKSFWIWYENFFYQKTFENKQIIFWENEEEVSWLFGDKFDTFVDHVGEKQNVTLNR